MNMVHIFFYL